MTAGYVEAAPQFKAIPEFEHEQRQADEFTASQTHGVQGPALVDAPRQEVQVRVSMTAWWCAAV